MKEIILSDDVIEQIKDFDYWNLADEQKSLVDKLIVDEELKENYKKYGLCKECKQPNTSYNHWCQSCNGERFNRNFKIWTSGNSEIDKLIQRTQSKPKNRKHIIEWIEHDRFENIEYLAKGGFGTTFKATWKDGCIVWWDYKNNQWKRWGSVPVALKRLDNSQDVLVEFLKEIELHNSVTDTGCVVQCFGITKDPKTNSLMMVMEFASNGSLRQHLDNSFSDLNWNDKLYNLYMIANGLADIHGKKLIHRDFHCGNILSYNKYTPIITDLGLCKSANERLDKPEKNIYGVLPYVAPEVLRGKEYTQASDIYGFGIIAYEFCTGCPPYHDIEHDESLAIRICRGLRPNSNYKIPQLLLDIIIQCWDADPLKRPNAKKLTDSIWHLYDDRNKKNSEIYEQLKEADEINKKPKLTLLSPTSSTISQTTHPQAIYTSRLLSFKNLPEPKNVNYLNYSESVRIDFTNLNFEDNN